MVLAAEMREIHQGGAAPELSIDGVIEVAIRGPLSTAGESAGLVDQLPHPPKTSGMYFVGRSMSRMAPVTGSVRMR